MLYRSQQFGIDARQPRQGTRVQPIVFLPAFSDQTHLARLRHDYFVPQLFHSPAYPRRMRPRLPRHSAVRHRPEHLSQGLRRCTQFVFEHHLPMFIQHAIPTPTIPEIQSHGVLLLRKLSGLPRCHSDTLRHSRSPLYCASTALSLGAYRIPPGDRLSHPIWFRQPPNGRYPQFFQNVYNEPALARANRIRARDSSDQAVPERSMNLSALFTASSLALALNPCGAQVTTSQYNNSRTAATQREKILTPQNVNAEQFGKLGAFKVDGAVYAQPLYVPAVPIPGKGTHDVLYVATEHDSVYALDANRPSDPPLWKVNFLDKSRGVTTLSEDVVACPFIRPEVGITSTPVIDLKTGTLYVLARTMVPHTVGADEYFQRLHALAVTTGVEKFGAPKLIAAAVPGNGRGSVKGTVAFDPLRENPRAALTLTNNALYLTWASSCDVDPYHGWVMAYDPQTLAQRAVLNVTPDGNEAGIWLADTGPAADADGYLYVPTGNGTFSAGNGGRDYGDSVLKLDGSTLAIRDYFTPHDQARINEGDSDVGSSGPTLLPDQPGPHRHLLLQPTKDSTIYVIDRDKMGKFHPDTDALVQKIRMGGGGYGAMAYWNGHAFFAASDDYLRDYAIKNGQLILSESSAVKFANPVATPSVSADGTMNAIVWAIATRPWNGPDNKAAVLYAFDASKLSQPIYTSEQNSQRDRAALATRFVIPLVVNGRVYFGTRSEVEVYGLLQ